MRTPNQKNPKKRVIGSASPASVRFAYKLCGIMIVFSSPKSRTQISFRRRMARTLSMHSIIDRNLYTHTRVCHVCEFRRWASERQVERSKNISPCGPKSAKIDKSIINYHYATPRLDSRTGRDARSRCDTNLLESTALGAPLFHPVKCAKFVVHLYCIYFIIRAAQTNNVIMQSNIYALRNTLL